MIQKKKNLTIPKTIQATDYTFKILVKTLTILDMYMSNFNAIWLAESEAKELLKLTIYHVLLGGIYVKKSSESSDKSSDNSSGFLNHDCIKLRF